MTLARDHPSQRERRRSRRRDALITACTTLPGTTRKTMPNAEYRAANSTSGSPPTLLARSHSDRPARAEKPSGL